MGGASSHDFGTRARRVFIKSSRLTRIWSVSSRQSRWPRMYRCGDGADDVGPPGVILGGFSFWGRNRAAVHSRTPPCAHWQLPPTRRRLEHSGRLGVTAKRLTVGAHPWLFSSVYSCITRSTGVIRCPRGLLSRTLGASRFASAFGFAPADLRGGARERRILFCRGRIATPCDAAPLRGRQPAAGARRAVF